MYCPKCKIYWSRRQYCPKCGKQCFAHDDQARLMIRERMRRNRGCEPMVPSSRLGDPRWERNKKRIRDYRFNRRMCGHDA